jgi:hypothetical protein
MVQTSKIRRGLSGACLIWLAFISPALGVQPPHGGPQVTLGWIASPDPTVVGYYLYYWTTSGVYNVKIDVGTNTMYTVSELTDGSTNYFTAASYNAAGIESSFVPTVSYIVPGIPTETAGNTPGSFAYTPANGTALNAGTNTPSVIFTPTDTLDYSSAADSVSLVISPAPLSVTAANASRLYGATNPVFTGTITGLQNGDNITATYSCSATANSPAGTYAITPTLVDPNNSKINYTVSLVNGTLAVTGSPVIQTAGVTASSFTLTWGTVPSQQYQVQSTSDLAQNNWTNLGDTITASKSTMTISEPIGTNARQFYRVVLFP